MLYPVLSLLAGRADLKVNQSIQSTNPVRRAFLWVRKVSATIDGNTHFNNSCSHHRRKLGTRNLSTFCNCSPHNGHFVILWLVLNPVATILWWHLSTLSQNAQRIHKFNKTTKYFLLMEGQVERGNYSPFLYTVLLFFGISAPLWGKKPNKQLHFHVLLWYKY